MKKKILSLLLFISPIVLLAQVNETEAKAAYILSEESYLVGEYATALNYLAKAEEKLGQTNSKLLFLKVQILSELYKNDKSYYEKVLETITAFQSDPEIKNFNREKVLEVYKIKMLIESKIEEELLVTDNLNNKIEELEKNYEEYSFEGWPFGVEIERLKVTHADSLIFQKKLKSKTFWRDKNLTAIYPASIIWAGEFPSITTAYTHSPYLILTKGGVVKGYRKVLSIHQNYEKDLYSYSNDKDSRHAVVEIEDLVSGLSNAFGVPIKYNESETLCSYIWENPNKIIQLYVHIQNDKRVWYTKTVLEIIHL